MQSHRVQKITICFFLFLMSLTAFAKVERQILSQETQIRLERVPEFAFIKEEANKLGVKVYLFGGTASAFAHYVRWDLEREAGDEKYQAERFDYDFTNIYRGNQDLDIVVDGTAEQAASLQEILKTKYQHFVGSKEAWEVRLLRAEIGDKLPLLDNPDFLNQHTDTNSTGMIAVNAEPGEIIFRDLFAWENPDSVFLNDVASGRIKFLFSDNHETTSRFKNGKNPPVFAAIRYLAKLAQYEVDEAEGDLEIIKRIVEGTNWDDVKNNSYVVHKLEEFGKKVLLNAPDSEYAWNLLEETGLRKRLIEMDGNRISSVESLSWWMNKEPLRTKPLGEGNGKTAAEIFKSHMTEDGEIVVAHETNSFEAYENITRSSHGAANAFISRDGVSGEVAALGDGFYTRLGVKGARGTNLTIRFKLNPSAREGEDFIYKDDFIVVKNKAALELIQENLNISMVDFFRLFTSNSMVNNIGLKEKLYRKLSRQDFTLPELEQSKSIVKKIMQESYSLGEGLPEELQLNYFYLDSVRSFEELYAFFTETVEVYFSNTLEKFLGEKPHKVTKELAEKIIKKGFNNRSLVHYVFADGYLSDHPELVQLIIDKGGADKAIIYRLLNNKEWAKHPSLVMSLLKKGSYYYEIAEKVLSNEIWADHPELALYMIDAGKESRKHVLERALYKRHWAKHPMLIKRMIEEGYAEESYYIMIHFNIIQHVLPDEAWSSYPELVELLINNESNRNHHNIAEYILTKKYWSVYPELLMQIIDTLDPSQLMIMNRQKTVVANLFDQEFWVYHPELLEYLNDETAVRYNVVSFEALKEKNKVLSFKVWRQKKSDSVSSCKGFLR